MMKMMNRLLIVLLMVLSMAGAAFAAETAPVLTNKLDAMKATYLAATDRIATDTQSQKDTALIQYGKTLDAILMSLKQKGDIDGYGVVDKELNRFRSDQTVPNNSPDTYVANAAAAYQKQLQDIDVDAESRRVNLLRQYIAALGRLVKDLMMQDKIEDAKAAGEVKRSAEAALAVTDAKLPKLADVPKPQQESVVRSAPAFAPAPVETMAPSENEKQFVVECNGMNVTNALIVIYAGGGKGYPFMTWGRTVITYGKTQSNGVKLHIPPGKFEYQVNVFASGYEFYSGKDEELKGNRIVVKLRRQASKHGADRWVYLPRGAGVPLFSNSEEPEIELVFMSHTCPPNVKAVSPLISFHHGLKEVTTHPTFDVYKGDPSKNPQIATCKPIWYFGLDGKTCPPGLVMLVNEK